MGRMSKDRYTALVEAASLLREYCTAQDTCYQCIFRNNAKCLCMLSGIPSCHSLPNDPATTEYVQLLAAFGFNETADKNVYVGRSEYLITDITQKQAKSACELANAQVAKHGLQFKLTYSRNQNTARYRLMPLAKWEASKDD